MTSRDFCYWLQGFFEITNVTDGTQVIQRDQVEMIKKHLNLVFKHEIDPSMGNQEHQNELNQIHNKPTLIELGKKHNFEVLENVNIALHGTCPGEGYSYNSLHGWYKESEGIPRC